MKNDTGYALISSDGCPFSWHSTKKEALERMEWENHVMGRALTCIPSASADWTLVGLYG